MAFALLLCCAFAMALSIPMTAFAQDSGKTVRVGWYESSFNTTDEFGRRSGYAYEYQMKVSAYTGWKYEYVSGSWSDLMQMLEDGDIDLMTDVSYKPDREGKMLFTKLPMGSEEYCLFVSPSNHGISAYDYSTINGKTIGVNASSIQADFFREWVSQQGLNVNLVELSFTEDEALNMLERGEIDGYVTVDSFVEPERALPVCRVGSSDYFFVVNNNRPDLLEELNGALTRIQNENPYYNMQMYEKYVKRAGANSYLPANEVVWLANHGSIKVGYQDNYLAFCAEDKTTGSLTGALKDYLDSAARCFSNTRIDFKPIAYPTVAAAFEALKAGEVDCVFPANLDSYDGELLGAVMTPPIVNTDICVVVREANQQSFASKEHVVVAVNEGNPNYEAFLRDHYPKWNVVYYPTTDDCLKAVADNVADCVLISNFRYSNIARQCEKLNLTDLKTNVDVDYSFAVGAGQMELYSILSKAVNLVPSYTVNSAISRYASADAKTTLIDVIEENLGIVLGILAAVLLVILALFIRSRRAEKKANDLIAATEVDAEYANRMYQEHPDTPMDAIVMNLERFHSVNALNGWEFGNRVLRALGDEIHTVSIETGGIAGRFGADRFDLYCPHGIDHKALFDRLQNKLNTLSHNVSIRLRMGVMEWQAGLEPVQMFDRARTACSMARGHYAEHLIVFDENIRDREIFEQRLMNDLRRGLDSYEFEVHYQPQYDIRVDPPKPIGAEALVRWRHPELGLIPPDDFIPLFEQNGQIGILDKYVWQEVARQIARWQDGYGMTAPVSVNLSRVDVFDPELEKTLEDTLRQNGLDHNALKLEVTESAYTENATRVIKVVESLRKSGFKVGMDDFGMGYSSLSMLSSLPVDALKMDGVFIQNIERDAKDAQLVALILGIADTLKIPVIAEGVETEEQMTFLKNLGCEMVQGFYLSRPLQAPDFERLFFESVKPDDPGTATS